MRIHHLAITGIGPYASRQELDFDELSSAGLFLLTGPTGAGKTTILDAVVYALYGSVPGARGKGGARGGKGTSERIVSDLRSIDVQPQVELECTVAGRRLRIVRTPQHTRRKTRGEGVTVEKSSVSLAEFVGGEWVARSTDHQEVAFEVGDLLGMNAAQFAQVVLLPQGEFAGFLRADVAERRAVLERLFDVEQYQAAEAWFEVRAKDAQARLEEAQDGVREIVDRLAGALGTAAGLVPEDRSLDAIERWIAERRFAADEVRELATVDAEATAAARSAALAAVRSTELAITREADAALRRDALARLDERLRGAQTWIAAHESPELAEARERWAEAAQEADAHRARLTERASDAARVAELRAAAHRHAEDQQRAESAALAAQAEVERLAPAAAAASETATRASVADEVLAATVRHRDQLLERQRAGARRARLLAERPGREQAVAAALQALRDAMAAASAVGDPAAAESAAAAAAAELAAHELACSQHAAAIEQATGRVQRSAEALERSVALRARLDAAHTQHAPIVAAWQDARQRYLDARAARLDAMAAELAAGLTDGDPCPVCGGVDHPAPAAPAPGGDLRVAEHDAEQAAERAQRAAAASEAGIAELHGQLGQLGDPAELERDHGQATAELAEWSARGTADAARRDELRAASARAQERLAAARDAGEVMARAERELRDAKHALALLDAELETHHAEGEPAAVDPAELDAAEHEVVRIRALQAEAAGAREQAARLAEALDAARRTADEQRAAAAGSAAAARSARLEAEDLAGRIAELIAPHADLDAALAHASGRARNLRTAADLVAERAAAEAELTAATAAATAAREEERVDAAEPADPSARLRARQAHLAEAESARDQAAAAVRDATRHTEALDHAAAATERARDALGPALEEAERLARLAATVRGLGDNQRRMSLTTYVLAARLEEVAAAATVHLLRMSSGRYSLVHHDERYGGGAAGLGLRVLDAFSGEERDTATLSGGEAFYASLALALGLADVVQREAGGRPLETLLVDEGFGALDPDTLEEVLGELDELRAAGRAIGLVSHVPALAERIPAQLRVTADAAGSTARVAVGEPA